MALESATYIDELVSTNPLASDNVSQGDNHLRLIKSVLQSSFPSVDMAVNAIHASDSAPAVAITAGLIWFDTSANLLKIRNEANDAWVTLAVSPVTSNSVDINAGTVDGAIIGGSSAAAGTFTTLTANTSLTMAEDATIIFEGATDDAYETTLTVVDPTADRTVSLPNATDTLVGLATTDTLTNKTLTTPTITSPVVNTGISGTAVLDSDTMSGASATTVATSESIKAYVDSQVTAQDLDVISDSGTIDIDLDSESLTVAGGSGLNTSATGSTLTVAGDDATTSAKGVASFSSDNFSVSSGAVTIKDAGVANAELANMAANTVKVRNANSSGVPSDLALATTEILIGDGTGFTAAALSGDVTMANTGAVTIASGAVENSMLADMAANTVKVRDANSSGAPSDKAVADTQVLIGDGTGFTAAALSSDVTMTNAGVVTIADNAVSLAKMAGLARGKIIYGDASGDPAALAVGSANYVLTSDGTDISWAAATTGDITAVNVTSPITGGGSSGDVTIAIQDASTSAKGAASFSSDNFAASSGAITIKDAGVANAELANMAANTVKVRDANSSGVPSDKAVADTQILIGDGTGFTAAALSGDVTMANTGAVTIAANSVDGTMIALGSDAQGDVMYYNGTNWARLGYGTDGHFLKTQGASANPVWAAGAGGGATDINGLSDALVENNSIWLGSDPSGTTDTASNNVAVGTTALDAVTTADETVAIGYNALTAATTGTANTAVGSAALAALTTGSQNTSVGKNSSDAITEGDNNTAIGDGALSATTTADDNTALGVQTLKLNTTGATNTAVGRSALFENTTGANNVAVGYQALDANTTATQNVAIGNGALGANTTVSELTAVGHEAANAANGALGICAIGYKAATDTTGNYATAVGYQALFTNTTGANNTALGWSALRLSTDSANNTGLGYNALTVNTTGANNTAVGSSALDANTTGSNLVALGHGALGANLSASYNVAVGVQCGDALTTGDGNVMMGYNTGTTATTSTQTVLIGYEAGDAITTASHNTGIGGAALGACTTGGSNTAVGYLAGGAITGATNNVAVGAYCLDAMTGGGNNVAVGYSAMGAIVTGSNNVAMGQTALSAHTSGNQNVAVGQDALTANTIGSENTAIGALALSSTTTAGARVAVGYKASEDLTSGAGTTAVGYQALNANTTGGSNAAVGYNALLVDTTGASNTAIGHDSGKTITTGSHNTAIGRQALGKDSAAVTGGTNTALGSGTGNDVTSGANNTFLGYNSGDANSPSGSVTTGSNQFCLGDNDISDLFCADTSISSSDERDKADITDFTHGLSFVKQLRPVTYKWDKRSWYAGENPTSADILAAVPDGSRKKSRVNLGLLAQEVQTLEQEIGYGNSKEDRLVTSLTDDEVNMGLKYERIVPILVNAIKELSDEIDSLKAQL